MAKKGRPRKDKNQPSKADVRKLLKLGKRAFLVKVYADGVQELRGRLIGESSPGLMSFKTKQRGTNRPILRVIPKETILSSTEDSIVLKGRITIAEIIAKKIMRKDGVIWVQDLEDKAHALTSGYDVEIISDLSMEAESEDKEDEDEEEDEKPSKKKKKSKKDEDDEDEDEDDEDEDEDEEDEKPSKKKKKKSKKEDDEDEDEGEAEEETTDDDWNV